MLSNQSIAASFKNSFRVLTMVISAASGVTFVIAVVYPASTFTDRQILMLINAALLFLALSVYLDKRPVITHRQWRRDKQIKFQMLVVIILILIMDILFLVLYIQGKL